uniref:HECT-type E3 ubiquitin transferase n=1 Tax=Globisporangium ultimum (strain ATCC 200006 / CBS 805.95 / DAOM BR144) TaxID=431595 RepID=K3X459_GLOUD
MVLLETTLTLVSLGVVKGLTALYVRHDNNKEYGKMKDYAPLLVYEKLDRVRHAADTIGKAGKKRAKKLKYKNPLNARFVRASKRKEWVRKVNAEGKAYWHCQEHLATADARFTGFVVMFQLNDGGALRPEGEEKTAQLVRETEALSLELIESTKADPWMFALGGALESNEFKQEVIANGSLNFPAKYAAFVAKAVAALEPTKKIQLRLTLNHDYVLEQSLEHVSCMDVKYARSEVTLKFLNGPRAPVGKQNREWIAQLNELLTNPSTGLFKVANNSEQTYYLNSNSKFAIDDDHLTYYYAAGRLLGRGLLDGALWGFHLATPLLKIILGLPVSFTDLAFFDSEAYKSLEYLANNTGVESLSLDFSVTEKVDGEMVVVDLVPDGRNIAVTDANKFEYLDRRFKYTLFESVSSQLYAFLRGIYEVVPQEMLMMLDPEEFDFIMCGSDVINTHDWRINSKYNECIHGHPCMNWFWKYVRKMPLEYKKRLLHFTTGNTRVPIGGFAALTNYNGDVAPFTIIGNELMTGRLMRGQPCFNKLELPNYVHRKHLKSMLFGILDNYDYTSK